MQEYVSKNGYLVPNDWDVKPLEDFFNITSSKRVFQNDWQDHGIPFYRAREIVILSEKEEVDNELFISEQLYNLYSCKYGIPQINDILVTGVGTIGKAYIVSQKGSFYFKDGNIIWFKSEDKINSNYIKYLFQSPIIIRQIENTSLGTTVKTYTIISAKKTLIPAPQNPKEQQKIVSILISIEQAIKTTESIIKKQQNIKSGLLHDLLTYGIDEEGNIRSPQTHRFVEKRGEVISEEWEIDSIENLFYLYSGATPSTTVEECWNGEIVWITPNDLNKIKHIYIDNSERKITTKGLNCCSATIIPKNSIVMSSRAPIGYLAISTLPFATNQGCKSFHIKNETRDIPEFFYFYLQFVMDKIKSLGTGTTFQEVSKTDLNSVILAFPSSKEEQKNISNLILKQDKMIEEEELKLEKLKNIKKGLMEDLLTGRKRVKY